MGLRFLQFQQLGVEVGIEDSDYRLPGMRSCSWNRSRRVEDIFNKLESKSELKSKFQTTDTLA